MCLVLLQLAMPKLVNIHGKPSFSKEKGLSSQRMGRERGLGGVEGRKFLAGYKVIN